ncbi:MAG: tRNA pseudouridine(38-40) synthase TruA [Acidimicrobiia bacterium]
MLRRARLLVAYDGTSFHGFAGNPGVRTVAGVLVDAISKVARHPVELTGAGRTDAGVHGWGQVISCDLPEETDLGGLARRVSSLCAPAVAIRSACWATPDFDARFSASWRHYRYTVLNTPLPNPFLAATAWHVPQPLDVMGMRLGCDPLIGEHDFSSFCRRPKLSPADVTAGRTPPTLVRRVLLARWDEVDDGVLRFEIRATAFCHQMVRSIVGTLVEVGLGRRRAGQVRGVLIAKDRSLAGPVAPPQGLCLWEVGYPDITW